MAEETLRVVDGRVVEGEPGGFRSMSVGDDFGKYRLLGVIGRGGMGIVYRALQIDLERTVALKLILSNQLASPEEVRRFYAEAKAAGGLRHPHIVGIHEVGQIDGQHYFAMDFVDGPSLAQRLAQGSLEFSVGARWLETVARAVEYLHSQNIIHRDLKPSNILLDQNDNPFVTDFGLAKVFETDSGHTQTGTILGTPSYMSPEQAAGRTSDITPRSDVYSLGAILYEMLTGRAADAIQLTFLIHLSPPPMGPLLIGYPLLIVASGLWFRVPVVWFMTACCLPAYAALIWLRPEDAGPMHYPLIHMVVLTVIGFIVAHQVYRLRILSRHYDQMRA